MDKKLNIAKKILTELDQFNNFTAGKFIVPDSTPFAAPQKYAVYENQKQISKEPFISYLKVFEVLENGEEKEFIFLVCRNYTPMGLDPVDQTGMFINRNAPLGTLASSDVGDEVIISFLYQGDRIKRTFFILEKNIFIPLKKNIWDATENNIFYDFEEEFIPSLRDLVFLNQISAHTQESEIAVDKDIDVLEKQPVGINLIKELDEIEIAEYQKRKEQALKNQSRNRAIVESIALKDQPILDKFQNEFCRLPLASKILLTGSPGTGKTTTLIKRLAFKSDSTHLETSEELELKPHQLENWLMFTPNDLLKIYLKEAMNKEGLSATDKHVVTWEKERITLGRDYLKFLKTPKSGTFSKTADEILNDVSSSNLIEYTNKFIEFFNNTVLNNFFETITKLEENQKEINKLNTEYDWLGRRLGNIGENCQKIKKVIEKREVPSPENKTIFLINEFRSIKTQLDDLRNETNADIKQILDDIIIAQPHIIDQVVEVIAKNEQISEQSKNAKAPQILSKIEKDKTINLDDETAEEKADLRVEARKQIRQTFIRYAENAATQNPINNKRQMRIWEIISPYFENKEILILFGRIRLALREMGFRKLDYNEIFKEIASLYELFRLSFLATVNSDVFNTNAPKIIENKKISLNEIDVLIYVMLKFASKVFENQRDFLRKSTNLDILENIKSQYHTQIAVDEAADFSAVQLGCMFYLAHPTYQSVSFAGDLMQRVTRSGLNNWKECKFISEDLEEKELNISYRQTPALLSIAAQLYENVIGQKPPFQSKYKDTYKTPSLLKFQSANGEKVGDWITQRVHEIYEINDSKLPSIAIFVPEEDDIETAYQIIHEKLNDISIDVEMCREGKILGTGSKIRIFSVQFIKGLEFEGVFFLDIDEIHNKMPDLLDKFLYVGLTRATTFLGVTYKTQFPERIQFIEDNFDSGDWSNFI